MKTSTSLPRALPFLRPALASLLAFIFVSIAIAQTPTGRITGVVTNTGGNAYLEGATVTIDGTNRATTTDRRGEFDFSALTAGEYSLRIAYTGMTAATTRVTVTAGQTASITTALSEDVIKMGTFSVTTNRNADALAVTEQQHAPNVKNVVDIAAYGMLNNDNPVELLQLLPGVSGFIAFNEVDRVSVRGIDSSLNNVQLDGNSFATPAINGTANTRASVLSTTNTGNIKSAEVIKAITPDRSADAIGGMVNLIQRSALDYPKSAPRFEYRVGGQYVNTRSGFVTRPTPNAQFTYHDTFGAKRDWGVFLTGGFNKESTNQLRSIQTITNNATFGIIPTANQAIENDRFRFRRNWSATIDHRRGNGAHEFAFKVKHDDWLELTQNVFTNIAGAVPAADWTRERQSYSTGSLVVRHVDQNPYTSANSLSFEGKHRVAGWEASYNLFTSDAKARVYRPDGGLGGSGRFLNSTFTLLTPYRTPFVVQSKNDPLFPTVTFTTANPDVLFNADNYQLDTVGKLGNITDEERSGARFDLKRRVAWTLPVTFKAGLNANEQSRENTEVNFQKAFVGEDRILGINPATGRSDDRLSRFVNPSTPITGYSDVGNRRPFLINFGALNRSFYEEPQLWLEDPYANALRSIQNDFKAKERITAGYFMAETDWKKFHFLAGARWEKTKVTGTGVFTNPIQATAAQIPDPVQRAINNAGPNITRTSSYRNTFPSVHMLYKFRPELQARASYSTGIGRPGFGSVVPNTTVNEATDVVTTGNTGLRPQFADNYDLSLEYYTEPAGLISLGLFRKDISDYIVNSTGTVPPGFPLGTNDQYVGYQLRTSVNGGYAKVQGVEFNLVRQLNFIPRTFGLFTFKANATVLTVGGKLDGVNRVGTTSYTNFIPRSWNLVGEYAKGRFYALARYNQQAEFLQGTNVNPALLTRTPRREKIDLNFGYRWRRSAEFFFAIDNLTERPSGQFIGVGDRRYPSAIWAGSRRFNLGVQGKF